MKTRVYKTVGENTMCEHYDVMVIGGGTAGVVVAVQAGARTMLVEKTGLSGGTITNAGVGGSGLL